MLVIVPCYCYCCRSVGYVKGPSSSSSVVVVVEVLFCSFFAVADLAPGVNDKQLEPNEYEYYACSLP